MRRAFLFTLLLGLVAVGIPPAALAKTSQEVPYPFDVLWPTALRFVRVDYGWKITEHDKEAGFLRFDLVDDKQKYAATLEIIATTDRLGRQAVKLQLHAPGLTGYRESIYLEKLSRKVREEQGPPADSGKRGGQKGGRDASRSDGPPDGGANDASP